MYSSHYPANGGFVQPHLHEDYRPIYFYVAQPYTIPYTFAKRPRPSSLLRSGKPRSNCRVKFSKRLGNNDFSQKVKQGEFSRSLSQVHFVENQGQGMYLFIIYFISSLSLLICYYNLINRATLLCNTIFFCF